MLKTGIQTHQETSTNIDFITNKLYKELLVTMDNYKNKGFLGMTFTSESIIFFKGGDQKSGIFALSEENIKKLIYGLVRYFILERGLDFPNIIEQENNTGMLFSENKKNINDFLNLNLNLDLFGTTRQNNQNTIIKQSSLQEKDSLIETKKNAKDFIIYCIETFSNSELKDEFIISNQLVMYFGDNKHNFNFSDLKEILIASRKNKNTMFEYMLKTECDIIGDIIQFTENISEKEIKNSKDRVSAILGSDIKLIEDNNESIQSEPEINELIEVITDEYIKSKIENTTAKNISFTNSKIKKVNKLIQIKISKIINKGNSKYNLLQLGYNKRFRPIGGKIHFSNELEKEKIEKLNSFKLFLSSPFKLQHANTSMLLPPCESPFQLIEILKLLDNKGIINDGNLELQLSIAGRLPNNLCAIIGSAMIFLKNYQVTYPKEAFCTGDWNDLTKSCIICYDAGVLEKEGFKNIGVNVSGRTDILGIKRIEEVINFSIISNLVSQSHFGGKIEKIGTKFINEYLELLEKYNISDILNKKWVHNPDETETDINNYEEHYFVIKKCTDILNENISKYNTTGDINSFKFDLHKLLNKYINKYKLIPIKNLQKISTRQVV